MGARPSMLVFWVAPSLLAFSIVRRLAASAPPTRRILRWLLVAGCAVGFVTAIVERSALFEARRAPLAISFGAVAFAAFMARVAERRQVASNLLGGAQSLLFVSLSIGTSVFRARENRGLACFGPHPLAWIHEPDGRSLHEAVAATDVATVFAALVGLASLVAGARPGARQPSQIASWLATFTLGFAAQFVFVHAPGPSSRLPESVTRMPLPTLASADLGSAFRPRIRQVDVVLDSSPPYRVLTRDERVLRMIRDGGIPTLLWEQKRESLGLSDDELTSLQLASDGGTVRVVRLVVAAPASMPLERLGTLARDLELDDWRPAFSLVVAIDVHREQPGLERSPAIVRRYARFDLTETTGPSARRTCARIGLDADGRLHAMDVPAFGPYECVVDLHVDPRATAGDLVRGIGRFDFGAIYRLDSSGREQAWSSRPLSTGSAAFRALESGFWNLR